MSTLAPYCKNIRTYFGSDRFFSMECSGVIPRRSVTFGSAPHSSSALADLKRLHLTANISGVSRPGASRSSAPAEHSHRIAGASSLNAAAHEQ